MNSKEIIKQAEKDLREQFEIIDEIRDFNQEKVLNAFIENKVAPEHFYTVSGYGHDDMGREVLDKVFADVFKAEKAIARIHFASGTHTLACVLFGNLRPGNKLISVAGAPYDTMQEVIGTLGEDEIREDSLIAHGVLYDEVPLKNDDVDLEEIEKVIDETVTMVLIQRSKGYSTRKSLTVDTIGEICRIVKKKNPNCICFVDNCYGEFVDRIEPSDVGADLVVGSLIKNLGGGIAPMGGYLVGRKDIIELAANRLTAPGLGKEVGASLEVNRSFYQGLFFAPQVVASALKSAIFAANLYENLGFETSPGKDEERNDIIQAVALGSPERIIAFCRGIQAGSPVDSYVAPEPYAMPGYHSDVIMAAGNFIQGSSIELSADAPIEPPYSVYFQGGLTWQHGKYGILMSLQKMVDEKIVELPK